MKMILKTLVLAASLSALSGTALAEDESFAPGGTAIDKHTEQYRDLEVIMDVKARDAEAVKYATMVASNIISHPGARLAVVIEGPMVSMFAKKNYLDHQGIVDQWVSLAEKGVKVEYCGSSVHAAHLSPSDMEGLTEKNPAVVNPGAYPAIAHYESQGYALVIPIPMSAPEKK